MASHVTRSPFHGIVIQCLDILSKVQGTNMVQYFSSLAPFGTNTLLIYCLSLTLSTNRLQGCSYPDLVPDKLSGFLLQSCDFSIAARFIHCFVGWIVKESLENFIGKL